MPEEVRRPTARETREYVGQRTAADRRRVKALLDDARKRGYGPDSTLEEKTGLAGMLHDGGCSWRQIGKLFGVSHETARSWVMNGA